MRVEGDTVVTSAADFGFSRPSFYQAAAALDVGGLPALLPVRPGPPRAHKLTAEIVAFLEGVIEENPSLGSSDLAETTEARFGVFVHPRSIERALVRGPKSSGR